MKNMPIRLTIAVLTLCLTSKAWPMGTEDFGDSPLSEMNYKDWPDIMPLLKSQTRVYHSWVNGNEQFYYQGDTKSVNNALQKFVAVKTEVRQALLRPGHGIVHSFNGIKVIRYNWNLDIGGGICQHLTTLDQGEKIWSKTPTMTICVGDDITLEKIEIPKGVSIVELADLSRRCRKALASNDKTVRGWGAGHLAWLDPYSVENLTSITKLLKDEDDWVRLNAAGAMATFGKKAESVLPILREMLATQNKQLKARIEKTIQEIQQAKDTTAAEQEHRRIQG